MGLRKNAERFFSPEERERIRLTVVEVESETTGEIAVMVVDRSSRYIEAEILGGIFLGSMVALVLTVVCLHSSLWFYIPLSFLLFFPGRLLSKKVSSISVAFIGQKRKNVAVKERALRAFYEKGLYRTKDQTGVLFFISLLERKVWVLADSGIHQKIQQSRLNTLANSVSHGIRDGRACEALVEAIGRVGGLLRANFPARSGDIDELPDEIICEPGGDCLE
jgi:putative membrane protein